MYRFIAPTSPEQLPFRMLLQPAGDGTFHRACEADSFRGLVAAVLDEPEYESADAETRLLHRLRPAHDVALLEAIAGRARPEVSDRGGANTIDVASDEGLIRSLDRLGYLSLDPRLSGGAHP